MAVAAAYGSLLSAEQRSETRRSAAQRGVAQRGARVVPYALFSRAIGNLAPLCNYYRIADKIGTRSVLRIEFVRGVTIDIGTR